MVSASMVSASWFARAAAIPRTQPTETPRTQPSELPEQRHGRDDVVDTYVALPYSSEVDGRAPVVAVDIDEVIAANFDDFSGFLERLGGAYAHLSPVERWRHMDDPEGAPQRQWLQASGQELVHAVPGAAEALQQLRAKGVRLVAVTTRPARYNAETQSLLARLLPPDTFEGIHFVQVGMKGVVCSRIGAVALVDDQVSNLIDAAACGILALLFDPGHYAWSQIDGDLPPGVIRIATWAAAVSHLLPLVAAHTKLHELDGPSSRASDVATAMEYAPLEAIYQNTGPQYADRGRPASSYRGGASSVSYPPLPGFVCPDCSQGGFPTIQAACEHCAKPRSPCELPAVPPTPRLSQSASPPALSRPFCSQGGLQTIGQGVIHCQHNAMSAVSPTPRLSQSASTPVLCLQSAVYTSPVQTASSDLFKRLFCSQWGLQTIAQGVIYCLSKAMSTVPPGATR